MTTRSYAFAIDTKPWAECPCVTVRILAREGDAASPINPRSEGEDTIWDAPKKTNGLVLAGLVIRTWVHGTSANYAASLVGPNVDFEHVGYVNERLARRLLRTLTRINKAISKSGVHEAGDVLMVVGKALGVTSFVAPIDEKAGGTWYGDQTWRWSKLTDARDTLREKVDGLRAWAREINRSNGRAEEAA
jgi:hypothetical protein